MAFRNNANDNTPHMYNRGKNSIFVGNISYEVSEDTIKSIFSQVGPIIHMKMVYDRETGRPRGYGFIEYADVQTAETAIRNLNQYDLNGRKLRVDSAVQDKEEEEGNGGQDQPQQQTQPVNQTQGQFNSPSTTTNDSQGKTNIAEDSTFPSTVVEPGKETEHIASVVSSMSPEAIIKVLKDMKECAKNCPGETRMLLAHNPQLAYALLQMQVAIGTINVEEAKSMIHPDIISKPFHKIGNDVNMDVDHKLYHDNRNIPSPMGMPSRRPILGPPQNYYQQPSSIIGNSQQSNPRRQPLQPFPVTSIPPQQSSMSPERQSKEDELDAESLMQLLNLTDEQIDALSPEDKQKVIRLKNELKNM
ncbi:Cleavage stimulation factor 64 kilodalton subunit [Strongyloides ratti]|uniref:Cleavage stimulation factor 64 kilodalton subunit n=1 Tax=Strongyloides ratti TaxID=34506 RepID=A0A090LI05_STRRB|nr:Cleavage stimulation factor 64 kilodalton subunit [Strongyloides ratti]CEF69372.1 Cleavage stimulation factor 64 kilodalton subunit [Strongyloides ratti]